MWPNGVICERRSIYAVPTTLLRGGPQAVMYRLREQVEERVLAKSKLLTALYEELVGTPIAAGISESATGTTDDASAEIIEKDIEQASLKTNKSDIQRDTLNNEAPFDAEVTEESTNKSMEMPSNTPIKVEVTELV